MARSSETSTAEPTATQCKTLKTGSTAITNHHNLFHYDSSSFKVTVGVNLSLCVQRWHSGVGGTSLHSTHSYSRSKRMISFMFRPLCPEEIHNSIHYEAGWARQPVWKLWRADKSLNLAGYRPSSSWSSYYCCLRRKKSDRK